MIKLGADELAKYPFLEDTGRYLKDMGFTLDQFGTDPDLRDILDRAYERIRVAADGQIYQPIGDKATADATLPRETFSFLLAIILLKLCKAHTLFKRFALAEARRAEKYLERDLGNISDKYKTELAKKVIDNLSGIQVEKRDDLFTIPIHNYLSRSVHFYEREWKLVNRRVQGGQVFLKPHEIVRLIRQESYTYINSKITESKTPEMIPGFEDHTSRLVQLSKRFVTKTVSTGEFPPCIKHAIDVLQKGENLPHSGRFMLATFLLARGQTIPQIAPLFKNAPDYNERVTLYQLNHLAGTGSQTKYSCPSCEKLRTQGLCFAIPECNNIFNPLQFGKR